MEELATSRLSDLGFIAEFPCFVVVVVVVVIVVV